MPGVLVPRFTAPELGLMLSPGALVNVPPFEPVKLTDAVPASLQ